MEQVLLPPWTKKRRLITLVMITGFILLASLFIGLGLYQIGIDAGILKQPFSKQQITDELMDDAEFIRAVRQSAAVKSCRNQKLRFEYSYRPPLKQVETGEDNECTKLVALHSTGADAMVEIALKSESREVLVAQAVMQFESVNTELMADTKYPTTRLTGVTRGVMTEMFAVGIDRQKTYLITYAPTDPTLTEVVVDVIKSFYSMPQ